MAPPPIDQPGTKRHLAIFRVASYVFGAPAQTIAAITDVPPLTRIPKSPPSILGAVNHRGQVVMVVGLRTKLGLPPLPAGGRSQLIIAELATGRTGFMVDEIEDVRLPDGMRHHPLPVDSAIDIFEAYLVDGERILLATTFQKIFDARETPPPEGALDASLQKAGEQLGRIQAVEAHQKSTATDPAPSAAPAVTDEPGSPSEPVTAPQAMARPRQRTEQAAAPEHPPSSATVPAPTRPIGRSGAMVYAAPSPDAALRTSGRPPWYRYAAVAALFLLLTVALGGGVWLVRQQRGRYAGGDQTTIGPTASDSATVPDLSVVSPPEPAAKPAATASSPAAVPGPQEDRTPEAIPETPSAPAKPETSAAAGTETPREVLRVETEDFTLTVERPGPDSGAPPAASAPHGAPADGSEEIRHIVVRGDTLWDIAAHYLGDPFQYPELARLSRIRDPDLIYPNDVIRIIKRTTGNKPVQQ